MGYLDRVVVDVEANVAAASMMDEAALAAMADKKTVAQGAQATKQSTADAELEHVAVLGYN